MARSGSRKSAPDPREHREGHGGSIGVLSVSAERPTFAADTVGFVAAHRARGDLFMSGARPGLISSGLRGATGLGVGRVTVAPFASPIRGTQLGDGCGL